MPMYYVFGTTTCPFCTQARQALEACGLAYKFYDLNIAKDKAFYAKTFEPYVTPAHKTIPKVFLEHAFIGGCQDLLKHLER